MESNKVQICIKLPVSLVTSPCSTALYLCELLSRQMGLFPLAGNASILQRLQGANQEI